MLFATLAFAQRSELLPPNGSSAITAHSLDILPPLSLSSSLPKEDRLPAWGFQETLDFIAIRSQLEQEFTHTKRNRTLWEIISSRMREKGHRRSPEQCKCKWKNLVNRYKGKETSEPDFAREFPFFDQLHAIFTERAKTAERTLLESESGTSTKKKRRKGLLGDRSSEEFSDEEDEGDDESENDRMVKPKKAKSDRERQRATAEKCRANSMQEVLEEFFQQQQRMELQWREVLERREEERRLREEEFRNAMEKLENERIVREQHWREREEQRRSREEARSEKRDALFSAILTRLAGEL